MSSTKSLAILALTAALGGCIQAPGHMEPNFGFAVRQDIVAQIADPDARYRRTLNPASNGERAVGAQERYAKGEVTPPASEGTGAIQTTNGGGPPPAAGK